MSATVEKKTSEDSRVNTNMVKPMLPAELGAAKEQIAVSIVGSLKSGGESNLAIGDSLLDTATRWAASINDFQQKDLNTLFGDIRDSVRAQVVVRDTAIRLFSWMTSALTRRQARANPAIGADRANAIPYHMWETLAQTNRAKGVYRALTFNVKDVSGTLRPDWVDFIKDLGNDILAGNRIGLDAFNERIEAHEKKLRESKLAEIDPAKLAAETAATEAKAKADARQKNNDAIRAAVTTLAKDGLSDPGKIADVVAETLRDLKQPAPWFDPATATKEDCKALVAAMRHHKRNEELIYLYRLIGKKALGLDGSTSAAPDRKLLKASA